MARTLQVRDLPDEVHAALRARAAAQGVSISDYVGALLIELSANPTMEDVIRRSRDLARGQGGASLEDVVAAVRDGRDRGTAS